MEMEKVANTLSWKLGGEAGFGIMSAGLIFAKACSRGGLNVFVINEYPSLIRGGHNVSHVWVMEREITSQYYPVDLLVALNKETVKLHKHEINPEGGIIYDGDKIPLTAEVLGRNDEKYSGFRSFYRPS
jgi:2-oxoglutarate ferredoxin oxidoreductase subunit alpha